MRNIRLSSAFRALSNRDYRLFFFGQGVSLIGTWMQNIAASWLIYKLTDSEFMLGIASFLGLMPVFIFSPLAGVFSDRLNRRKILITVQIMAMLQALTYAAITLTGIVQVWQALTLSCILGIINSFEMPVRQAFVVEMVKDRADLTNAIALNSLIFNASRFIGPAIAGIITAALGPGMCFLINGISYIAVITAFLSMNPPNSKIDKTNSNIFSDMKEGFFYCFRFIPIRDLLILISFLSLFAMTFPVLLPVFAVKVFNGDSHTFGILVSSIGAGAFLATIYLAMRKSIDGIGRVMNIAIFTLSLCLTVFSFNKSISIAMPILVIAGFSMIVVMASCNMVLQTIVEEDKRGRVMSFYVMAFAGTAPIGSLLAGTVSSKIGAPATLLICGAACFILATLFFIRLPSVKKLIK
ncbi:MAG: MFS transporter [Leptospirales bacterium]|nr:MFS transporter [Leptospirales bacterium]